MRQIAVGHIYPDRKHWTIHLGWRAGTVKLELWYASREEAQANGREVGRRVVQHETSPTMSRTQVTSRSGSPQ